RPWARDVRVQVNWEQDDNEDWFTTLPGQPDITIRLPCDITTSLLRLPTTFDQECLLWLISQSAYTKFKPLILTRRGVLRLMQRDHRHTDNYAQVTNCLDYLSLVSIDYAGCWYLPKSKEHPQGIHVSKTLEPALTVTDAGSGALTITLADWC